ncbi:chorismate mutase [Thermogutta sp.]|jgi:chorismate mutase|uniref:chorismate mutase n=1 Tax=Thermogutta sp. TaxID=1962930 RepID=UPI00322016A0
MVYCRGVRGATTADANTPEAILEATRQLLALMIRQNGINPDDIASAIFTTTPDLNAEFPALAARQLGWMNVAMLCGHELDVPGALPRCIRVLIHWNTTKKSDEIIHVYIKGAEKLRPDLSSLPPVDWEELERWIQAHLNREAKPSGRANPTSTAPTGKLSLAAGEQPDSLSPRASSPFSKLPGR